MDLVKDVSTVLGEIAVNSHHTPALYSTFLRALISARTDGGQQQQQNTEPGGDSVEGNESVHQPDVGMTSNPNIFSGNPIISVSGVDGMTDYQFAGEMGPVVDISTFPPTMAPPLPQDDGLFSMENFLSNGFWDSVLVPGKSWTSAWCINIEIPAIRLL